MVFKNTQTVHSLYIKHIINVQYNVIKLMFGMIWAVKCIRVLIFFSFVTCVIKILIILKNENPIKQAHAQCVIL